MLTLIRTKTLEEKIHQAVVKALREIFADPEYRMPLTDETMASLRAYEKDGPGTTVSLSEIEKKYA